ncbi:MAG: YhcH/YjgK/YiaL family protein [Abditibacteriota bacterium]|nr:YhcH/YjgK/YiaL family protein [Abditibacteriota bacterium]
MITDKLENAKTYYSTHQGLMDALLFLQSNDLKALSVGRHTISKRCFAVVTEYDTQSVEERQWEAHKRYIDVQYVVSGNERFEYAPVSDLKNPTPYDRGEDTYNLEGKGIVVPNNPGHFAVFFPQDGHKPGVYGPGEKASAVKKVIVKVVL